MKHQLVVFAISALACGGADSAPNEPSAPVQSAPVQSAEESGVTSESDVADVPPGVEQYVARLRAALAADAGADAGR